MHFLRGTHALRWLGAAVAAALVVLGWGALFLIAPVWQWQAPAAEYRPLASPQAVPAETSDKGVLDVNTATAEELTRLPGIGPVKAQAIVDYRTQHGPFADLQELDEVYGISAAMVARWQGLAVAGQPQAQTELRTGG